MTPEKEGVNELHDLDPKMNTDLMQLADTLGETLQPASSATKINKAMIGNVVPQFHLHVVARHEGDEA